MTLYHSFRELMSNFTCMWKVLLYRLIVLVLSFSLLIGLALPTLAYIFTEISATGFFANLSGFLGGLFNHSVDIGSFGEALKDNIVAIGNILINNMGRLLLTYVFILLSLCLSRFLNCVADYAITDVINSNMEACVKLGFVTSIFRNIGKAVRFSLAKVMFTVPIDGLLSAFVIYLFVVLFSPLGFFMPFVVVLIAVILFAFRMTLFSGWLPAVAADGCTTFGGLKEGVKMVFRRFWSVYSNWIILIFIIMTTTLLIGIFTFGVGVFVIVPLCAVLYNVFYLVLNYHGEGKKFYIDYDTIITPKALYNNEMYLSRISKESCGARPEIDSVNQPEETEEKKIENSERKR